MTTLPEIIVADLSCVGCGYNLRTLPADAKCVECGLPVNQTLQTTLLRHPSQTLTDLARYASLAGALNVIAMAGTLLTGLLLSAITVARPFSDPSCFLALTLVCYTIIAVFHSNAAFGFTTVTAGTDHRPRVKTIRISSVIFAIATLIPLFVLLSINVGSGLSDGSLTVFVGAWVLLLPSLSVFVFLTGRHFADLCRIGGLHSLAPWHRWLATTLAAGVALMEFGFLIIFLIILLVDPPPPRVLVTLLTFSLLGGLAVAGVGFIGATILLFRTARRLRTLAQHVTGILTGPAPAASNDAAHVTMPP